MTITLKDGVTPRIVISDAGNNVLIGSDISTVTSGSDNITLGIGAGVSFTSANECIAIGSLSQAANSVQVNNITLGYRTLVALNDATAPNSSQNIVIGSNTLSSATTNVARNIVMGDISLFNVSASTSKMITLGHTVGFNIVNASSSSILIGDTCGNSLLDCANCVFIGDAADSTVTTGLTNAIAIGKSVNINASNAVNIGNGCNVGLNTPSPLYSLDMTAIGGICAIHYPNSTLPPTPAAGMIIYSNSGVPTFMASDGVPHAFVSADAVITPAHGGTGTSTVFTQGSVVFAGASGNYAQDNSKFFWDDTNDRLGLGTASPSYNLDIATVSNVAAIRVADSSSTPSTPSGAALYYSVAGVPTYMNSNAVALSIPHRTSVTVSATSKTFALTDADTFQVTTSGSTTTLTVDTNANVAFPIDTEIDLFQQGAGQIVVAAAGGVTIQSVNSNLKIAAQYTGATLKKLATNTWLLTGNLTA